MNEVDLLKAEEGFRKMPYQDTRGFLTIGYGTNLADGLEEWEAEALLMATVARIRAQLIGSVYRFLALSPARQAVLVSMAYQMGLGGLFSFKTTLKNVEDGLFEQAAVNMLKSKWARQTPARAKRLSEMMRSGQWPAG